MMVDEINMGGAGRASRRALGPGLCSGAFSGRLNRSSLHDHQPWPGPALLLLARGTASRRGRRGSAFCEQQNLCHPPPPISAKSAGMQTSPARAGNGAAAPRNRPRPTRASRRARPSRPAAAAGAPRRRSAVPAPATGGAAPAIMRRSATLAQRSRARARRGADAVRDRVVAGRSRPAAARGARGARPPPWRRQGRSLRGQRIG